MGHLPRTVLGARARPLEGLGLHRDLFLFISATSAPFKNCGQLAVKTDVPVIFLFL